MIASKSTKPSPSSGESNSRSMLIQRARTALRSAARAVGRAEREFDAIVKHLDAADIELATAVPGEAVADAEAALATLKPRSKK